MRTTLNCTLATLVAIATAGCSSDDSSDLFGDDGADDSVTTVGASTSTSGGGETGDAESGTTGRFDVPGDSSTSAGSGDDGAGLGCRAVDFLFVIDNSGSMGDEQQALVDSFPAFIDAIDAELEVDQDYHLMTVDSDAWLFDECSELCFANCLLDPMGCGGAHCGASFGPIPIPFVEPLSPTYGTYQCDAPSTPENEGANNDVPGACDLLGAGLTNPIGPGASNTDCNFSSGARYIDSSQPDVKEAFSCAARVGTGGAGNERPMEAMVNATVAGSTGLGPLGECNDGFIRSDAILVVTFITDEEDGPDPGCSPGDENCDDSSNSAGDPASWRQALLTAKNGDDNGVVVLGIFDTGGSSPRLDAFVDSFGTNGSKGDVGSGNYGPFLLDAVSGIGEACRDYVPPAG